MQGLSESRGRIMRKYLSQKENVMKMMFFIMCSLVIVQPDFFYAAAGLDVVNTMMNNFYQLIATIFSGIGMVVALWAIGEIGGSWIGAGGGGAAQLEAFKRMGGAILFICAPQLVMLFKP